MSLDLMKNVLWTDLQDFWKPNRHVLAVGAPRSGKTTFLLTFAYWYNHLGELVVARDIGEFYEFFSLLDYVPITAFIPNNCQIIFNHPNLQYETYDPLNLEALFNSFKKGRINLIFFDNFCFTPKYQIQFWTSFFVKLLYWKRKEGRGKLPLTIIFDEFNDICPGKGRFIIKEQLVLSNIIAYNHRKFRRYNIRLVAASHSFTDLHPPVRKTFDCVIMKRNYSDPRDLPLELKRYARLMPKLEVNEFIFLDSKRNFNNRPFPSEQAIHPKRFHDIMEEGSVEPLFEEREEKKKEMLWRDRALVLMRYLLDNDLLSQKEIADMWNINQRTIAWYKYSLATGGFDESVAEEDSSVPK